MTHPIPNPYGHELAAPSGEERTWAVLGHLASPADLEPTREPVGV